MKKLNREIVPSDRTIKSQLRELRRLIATSKDPVEQNIAYGMECSIVWARERTVGWESPVIIAKELAAILRKDLNI